MKLSASQILAGASLFIVFSVAPTMAAVTTFEGLLTSPGTFRNDAGSSGAFNIDGASFSNSYSGGFWSGFAISNTTDITTGGYTNQYSAYPGSGAGGSSTYAVSYDPGSVTFSTPLNLNGLGASITNTTYASLSMQTGDTFAKKFGGPNKTDPDFFKLTISGFVGGVATGTPVDFYLADFRFGESSQDYIVNQWTFVDFSALGTVDEIRFSYTSTDLTGGYINQPTYFAIDNFLAVPEPSAVLLGLLGSLGLLARRRR